MIKVKQKIQFTREAAGKRRANTDPKPDVPAGRIPRISKLMALAIRYDRLIREGVVRDQSELARLANVSQPRMTQIMRLLSLAPDIQEALLFLPRVVRGKPTIHEKMLRPMAAEMDWGRQRRMWSEVRQD
jgi:hypothetical protein